MGKIHLLLTKEEIDEEKIKEGNKIVVVLDVLLATTTITSALHNGATEVIPVMNSLEALEAAKAYEEGQYILSGESKAKPIEGFVYPSPSILREKVKGKALILSTTNGTVAIRKASGAKRTYVSSLLNNPFVAEKVKEQGLEETILVICSGTSGKLSLEDFYGAGHFLSCLLEHDDGQLKLTDAAMAALLFYKGNAGDAFEIFRSSYVGKLFEKNQFIDELAFAAQQGTIPIVPILKGQKIVAEHSIKL